MGAVTTTDLRQLLEQAFERFMTDVHMAMPGVVKSYDSNTQLASVQPTIKRRFRGQNKPTDWPVIQRVPVIHPATASVAIHMPVKPGDVVWLLFADRAIDNWLKGDGKASRESQDVRMHHLSDAVAILGGYPEGKLGTPTKKGTLEIQLKQGTKIAITNDTGEDFISLIVDLVTLLLTDTHTGNLGYPTSVSLQTAQITELLTKLTTFKAG